MTWAESCFNVLKNFKDNHFKVCFKNFRFSLINSHNYVVWIFVRLAKNEIVCLFKAWLQAKFRKNYFLFSNVNWILNLFWTLPNIFHRKILHLRHCLWRFWQIRWAWKNFIWFFFRINFRFLNQIFLNFAVFLFLIVNYQQFWPRISCIRINVRFICSNDCFFAEATST